MVSGQAAAAVVISAVQVVSAAASVWGEPRQQVSDGSAEERSALIFFSFSTLFLAATVFLHRWMVRMPLYQQVAAALEKQPKNLPDREEIQGLIATHAGNTKNDVADALRVAKQNAFYEIAVAYVFGITLVSFATILLFHHVNEDPGCLPTHNNFNTANQSVDASIVVHSPSFFCLQPCGLIRSPRLFIPKIPDMVRRTTFVACCGKDVVHTPVLDV